MKYRSLTPYIAFCIALTFVIGYGGYHLWLSLTGDGAGTNVHRVAVNQIFSQAGIYPSPVAPRQVEIQIGPDGKLKHTAKNEHGSVSDHTGFPIDSEWMMCWDSVGQLWFFNPAMSPKYCTVYYVTPTGSGARTCGELGGWNGIPQEFLDKLPAEALNTYATAQAASAQLQNPSSKPTPESRSTVHASPVETPTPHQ